MRGTVIKKNLKKFRKARTFMCLYENKERKKEMKDKLKKILDEAMAQIDSSDRLDRLNEIKVSFLGKKGELTSVLKAMKDVAPEDRPKVGQLVNEARKTIEERLDEKREIFEKAILDEKLKSETIDVTLPGKKLAMGHSHPNTITLEEVEDIFVGMGYEVVEGPEVEYDYYNFEALNIPDNHPAKDEQDTFYITKDILLRSQTSSVQVHEMEKGKLPIRISHLQTLKERFRNLQRDFSERTQRLSSVLIISSSRSLVLRWMLPVLSVAEKDAVSARVQAG